MANKLKTEAPFVVFTDNAIKRFEDFQDTDIQQIDTTLGVRYEQKEIHADTVLLLRYNCPNPSCDVACYGWPDLHRHVKGVHHRVMCDLCTRNKKVFTHEHELFTPQDLRKHEKFGDDNPGAIDQSGFKGHPECGFCRQRFYGDDELYAHCRDEHERCHICDRRDGNRKQQYYVDYNSLEQHFRQDHFACADQECVEKKFIVFESQMDLKAHQLEAHPNGLTKDARRDARRVDLSTFDYRTPHQPGDSRGGRRGREGRGGGGGRGRDPNSEPLPMSTAQPLRRDELAYQRQMAVQNTGAGTARTFGGSLTATPSSQPHNGRGAPATQMAAPSSQGTTNPSFPPIDDLHITPPQPAPLETPQEAARRLHHASVITRASSLLQNETSKIQSFRAAISSYQKSTTTASQLIDTFFTLFDCPSAQLGTLIRELAGLFEDEAKREGLLKSWNDWRAVNEDYPSLPGPSGVLPGASAAGAGSGGMRVLRLKSSTAQSSRSNVSRQGSWGGANAAASVSEAFPAMPQARGNQRSTGSRTVPWTSSSTAVTSRPTPVASGQTNNSLNRPTSSLARKPVAGNSEAFPALPAAQKPNTFMMGLTRGTVRWDDTRASSNTSPWATSGGSASSTTPNPPTEAKPNGETETVVGGKKKQGKNKREVLYKFG